MTTQKKIRTDEIIIINPKDISIYYLAKFDTREIFFKEYRKRVDNFFKLYKDRKIKLPKGTSPLESVSADGKVSIGGLTITQNSNLFPSRELEPSVFSLIGQAGLDLCFCNTDSVKDRPCSIYNSDLWFGTNTGVVLFGRTLHL